MTSDLAPVATAWMDRWYDPAARLLWNPPGSYDELTAPQTVHLVPQSGWYAAGLLLRDEPGDRERAADIIEAIIGCQYDAPGEMWHGTFARFPEWPVPPADARIWVDYDPNWRQFVGTTFALLVDRFGDRLDRTLVDRMHAAVDVAVASEPAGRVPPSYSNIALMKAWLEVDAGTRTGNAGLVAAGEALAADVVALFDRHGAFDEYNSPTYYGVDLYAIALWRSQSPSPELREWGRHLEASLWRDVAERYHAGMRNLAGPYTRSYGMDMRRYAALLGLWVWEALGRDVAPFPDPAGRVEHGHDLCLAPCVSLLGAEIPDDVRQRLVTPPTADATTRRTISDDPPRAVTSWVAPRVMAGGERGELTAGGWGQFHPATVHWLTTDGDVGWIRPVHRGPMQAEARSGELEIWVQPHARRGPQPVTFEIADPKGAAVSDGQRWQLTDFEVEVETDARPIGIEVGTPTVVRFESDDGHARFLLRLLPR